VLSVDVIVGVVVRGIGYQKCDWRLSSSERSVCLLKWSTWHVQRKSGGEVCLLCVHEAYMKVGEREKGGARRQAHAVKL